MLITNFSVAGSFGSIRHLNDKFSGKVFGSCTAEHLVTIQWVKQQLYPKQYVLQSFLAIVHTHFLCFPTRPE